MVLLMERLKNLRKSRSYQNDRIIYGTSSAQNNKNSKKLNQSNLTSTHHTRQRATSELKDETQPVAIKSDIRLSSKDHNRLKPIIIPLALEDRLLEKAARSRGVQKITSAMRVSVDDVSVCKDLVRETSRSPIPKKVRFCATAPSTPASSSPNQGSFWTMTTSGTEIGRHDMSGCDGIHSGLNSDIDGKDSLGPIITTIYPTHSRYAYDRSPIVVDRVFNKSLNLPPRGDSSYYCDEIYEEGTKGLNPSNDELSNFRCSCAGSQLGGVFESEPSREFTVGFLTNPNSKILRENSFSESTETDYQSIEGIDCTLRQEDDERQKMKRDWEPMSCNTTGTSDVLSSALSRLAVETMNSQDFNHHLPSCFYSEQDRNLSNIKLEEHNKFITDPSYLNYNSTYGDNLNYQYSSSSSCSSSSTSSICSMSKTCFTTPSISEPLYDRMSCNIGESYNFSVNRFDQSFVTCDILDGF
ncbi:expressed protein [Phakopsora pachyrhizi]|uniref:Expressed protein n=1 Tax=Phakopsora pachyrhizi TaxID=170000 RepID=A0AAV0B0C7_PHAPC|nr:expressed protein [Phakopsora pachyrhizi]